MTSQQKSNLHPFVYSIKVVDDKYYPEIKSKELLTNTNCNVIIANDYNMYTLSIENNLMSLIKLERQDFHQHYFAVKNVYDSSYNNIIIENSFDDIAPYLDYCYETSELLLYYNKSNTVQNITKYKVEETELNFVIRQCSTDITVEQTDLNRLKSGFFYLSTNLYNYIYYPVIGKITIFKIDENGTVALMKNITGMEKYLSSVSLYLSDDDITLYIKTLSNRLNIMVDKLNTSDSTPIATVTVTDQLGVVNPGVTMLNDDVLNVIYGFNNDATNLISIANVSGTTDGEGNVIGLDLPTSRYNINKLQLYDEVLNPQQQNMTISLVNNIYNKKFSYFAYVSGTDQIRIVKIYHHPNGTSVEKYVPLLMWSTRLGAIDYYYDNPGGINLVSDSKGNIYVFIRDSVTYEVKIWVVMEYQVDLGHTEGTVVSSVDIIPELLKDMKDEYSIINSETYNFSITGMPTVNDVIISDIEHVNSETYLRFEYIDYNMLVLYPSIKTELQEDIKEAFVELYKNSSIDVYDIGSGTIPEGGYSHIKFSLPKGTLLKPCVIKGTTVISCDQDGRNIKEIEIENIKEGDYVINQSGKPVKILSHLISIIWAEKHNAPYLIPVNFFGENRPYKPLYISGDHGIMASNIKKEIMVYAKDISCLKRSKIMEEVEYHHLLLDKHEKNFFIANGLEVDSLHPGLYMQ
jgi:hypothetical protein